LYVSKIPIIRGQDLLNRRFFYGYKIVVAGSIIQMMHLGCVFTFGVFFTEFEKEFGWSRAVISGATSLNFFLLGIFGILMGIATDRYGPKIVLTFCGVLFTLGFLMMGQMTEVWELYLYYGVIAGIGMAAHDISTLTTVTRWFIKHRGLMSGIVKSGAGVGQVIVPTVATILLVNFGWRTACLTIGITALIIISAVSQVFRRDPQSYGLKPLGQSSNNVKPKEESSSGFLLSEVVYQRAFWTICFCKFSDMFCLFTIVIHIVPHGIDEGLSRSAAVAVLSTIGASSIIGRISLGMICDRIGIWKSLLICFLLLLTGLIVIQLSKQPMLLFLFAPIYGIGHGGFFAIAAPSVGHYFGTRAHGAIFGVVIFIGTLGGTIGPLLSGYFYDLKGNYEIAFRVLSGFAILGCVLALSLRKVNLKTRISTT